MNLKTRPCQNYPIEGTYNSVRCIPENISSQFPIRIHQKASAQNKIPIASRNIVHSERGESELYSINIGSQRILNDKQRVKKGVFKIPSQRVIPNTDYTLA